MIKKDEIRTVFSTFIHHVHKSILLFIPKLSYDRVHFQQPEFIIPAQTDYHVSSGFFLLRCIPKAIRTSPGTQPGSHTLCLFINWLKAIGKLSFKFFGVHASIPSGLINSPSTYYIYIQDHSILIIQPFEEIQVGQSLCLSTSFISVIYPGKILRKRGCFFICSRINPILWIPPDSNFLKCFNTSFKNFPASVGTNIKKEISIPVIYFS